MLEILNVKESGGDEFKRLTSAANGIDRDVLIQRGKLPLIVNSQAQEVNVRDLSMGDDRISFNDFKDTQILCPKMVTG